MEKNITEIGTKPDRNGIIRQVIFIITSMISVCTVWSPYMTNPILSAALCCFCGTVVGIICVLVKSTGTRFPIRQAILALIILLWIVFFRNFIAGFAETANTIIDLINSQFNTELVHIKSSGATFFDNLIFILLINSALAVLTEICTSKRHYAIIIIYLFINYKLSLILSVSYSFIAVLAIISAFGVCWSIGNNYRGRGANNAIFVSAIMIVCTFVSFAMFGNFRGSEQVMLTKKNITESFHKARYGDDLLPDGDMTKVADMRDDNKVRLEITAQQPILGDLYLYGYVGAEYDGYSSWKNYHTNEDAEWEGIFKWLSEKSFVPQTRYNNAFPDNPEISVHVNNKNADRSLVYVPFSLNQLSGTYKFKKDLGVVGKGLFGTKSYSFTYGNDQSYEDVLVEYSAGENNSADESDADSVYNAYVAAEYLKIDDETKQQMNDTFFNTDTLTEDSGLYSAISRIRTVMELRSVYSTEPDAYTGKESFTSWFLGGQRKSDSPYYTTIAVLALRAAGYPARYAEGYYATMSGNDRAQIRSDSGHAWCEVYLNNIGWIPVEVTPGYYQQSLLNKITVEMSSDNLSGSKQSEDKYNLTEEYNDTANDQDNTDQSSMTMLQDILMKLMIFGAILVAFVLYILLRDRIKRIQRKKILKTENPERYIYSAVMKIIRLGGVKCDETRPLESSEQVIAVFDGIRREEYERMISIMQKSVFGQKKLEKREIHALISFYTKIRKMLYKKNNGMKRLKLRFINNV